MGAPVAEKKVVENRRARHDYQILEKHEAGIELKGTEVKSLRGGKMVLKDSYADVVDGELFLVGAHISPYEQGTAWNHDPERRRRLLMHKREILRLHSQIAEKGLTLVPLRVYFKEGKAKIELGLGRGKKTVDKRAAIQERTVQRELERYAKKAR
jgi:SsrA-binding protein